LTEAHLHSLLGQDNLIESGEPQHIRREVLRRIFADSNVAPIGLSENIEAAPKDLIRVTKEFGFEGIVTKRKDSPYELGSEPDRLLVRLRSCRVCSDHAFVLTARKR
jgi:ATP-dependent DNA ligase